MRTKTPQQAEKMLEAAARLFGTQRFHEVRMEDIAAEAGVGKGTIYRYFNDKEELYLALLERASRQLLERIQKQVSQSAGARDRLAAIVNGIITYFDEQPHLLDLIQHAEVVRGPDFPWKQTRSELLRLVLDVFEAGRAAGEFHVADPELAALLLLAGLRGVLRFGQRPRPPDVVWRIVDGLLHGYARTPDECRGGGLP